MKSMKKYSKNYKEIEMKEIELKIVKENLYKYQIHKDGHYSQSAFNEEDLLNKISKIITKELKEKPNIP